MEKVTSLNSALPSSPFARQHPRSLKYYLSGSVHHKIVGRFATGAFLSDSYNESKDKLGRSKISNNSPEPNRKPETSQKKPDASEDSTDSKDQDNKLAKASRYSNVTDPGPIANYEQSASDPAVVKEMVKLSNEVLASASTVFPIDPFPDSIVLDRTTLNITKRTFFFSNDTLSIRIEDILNAHVNVGPFLGSLTIASRVLSSEDHFTISNLWRKDAIHLKHMIQGYIIALHNEIQISHLSRDELIETIRELGHDLNSK